MRTERSDARFSIFWGKLLIAMIGWCCVDICHGGEVVFQDQFTNKLNPGWSWIREHREAWRTTAQGLEVLIEPGNMWGGQNNARNLLVRNLPEVGDGPLEISAQFENKPTHQYEQADLVWYYDDAHMIKIGQELVDGKLSVVMGREENDKTRTISITPLEDSTVFLRLIAKGNLVRGQFHTAQSTTWRDVGECDMPAVEKVQPRICLQFYQGAESEPHWARVTNFRIEKGNSRP